MYIKNKQNYRKKLEENEEKKLFRNKQENNEICMKFVQ